MKKEEVIEKHPSICYNCTYRRRTASSKLESEGYIGCSKPRHICKEMQHTITDEEIESINGHVASSIDALELVEGWVDLRTYPFNDSSGIITNTQLMTKQVTACKYFDLDKLEV